MHQLQQQPAALWAEAAAQLPPSLAAGLASTDWSQAACVAVISYLGVRAIVGPTYPSREPATLRRQRS